MQNLIKKRISMFLAIMMFVTTVAPSFTFAEANTDIILEENSNIEELNAAFNLEVEKIEEEATVPVEEEATVPVEEEATVPVEEEATATVEEETTVPVEEDATVPVEEEATVPVEEVITPAEELVPATEIVEIQITTTGASTIVEVAKPSKSEFIVKLKDEENESFLSISSTFDSEALGMSEDDLKVTKIINEFQILEVDDSVNIEELFTAIESESNIDYIQPNYPLELYSLDIGYSKQWALNNNGQIINGKKGILGEDINLDYAWNFGKGDDVLVGVLDTGIDINHEDLKDRVFVNTNEIANNNIDDDNNGYIDDINGWDFYNYDNTVFDSKTEDEHGTHVSGIIAASNNGKGVVGVAPNVTILPMKFVDNDGGYTSDVLEAIAYAETMGVDIINCSFGSYEENEALKSAIQNSEILFVAAAGNDGKDLSKKNVYPASYKLDNVISVGSTNNISLISAFSNYNNIDIYAPGMNILSTVADNKYAYFDGTSQSAAYVTGAIALLKSARKELRSPELKSIMLQNARNIEGTEINILNVDASLVPRDAELINLKKLSDEKVAEGNITIINESNVIVIIPDESGLKTKVFRVESFENIISDSLKERLLNASVVEGEFLVIAKAIQEFRLTDDDVIKMLSDGIVFSDFETSYAYYYELLQSNIAYFSNVRKAVINGVGYQTFEDGRTFANAFGISIDSILYEARSRQDIDVSNVNEDHEIVARWLSEYKISKEAIGYISYTLGFSYLELDEMLNDYLLDSENYVPSYLVDSFEVISFDKEGSEQSITYNTEARNEEIIVEEDEKTTIDFNDELVKFGITAEEMKKLLELETNSTMTYSELEYSLSKYKNITEIEAMVKEYENYVSNNDNEDEQKFIKRELLNGVAIEEAERRLKVWDKESEPADFKLFSTSSSSNSIVSVDKFVNTGFILNEGNNVNINTVDGSMEFKLLVDELSMLDGTTVPLFLRYQSSRAMENEPGFKGSTGRNDNGKIIDEISRFSIAPGWSIQMSYFNPGNVFYAGKPWAEVYKFIDLDTLHLSDGRTLSVKKESDTVFKFEDEDVKDIRLEVCDTLAERNEFSNGQTFSAMQFANGQWDQRPSIKVIHNNGTVEYFNYYGYLLGVSNKNGNGYLVQYKVSQVGDMKYVYPMVLVSSTYDVVNFDINWGLGHNVELTTGTKKFIVDKEILEDGRDRSIVVTDIAVQNKKNTSENEHYRFDYEYNDVDYSFKRGLSSEEINAVRMLGITYPTGARAEFEYETETVDIASSGYIQKPFVTSYKLIDNNKTYLAKTYDPRDGVNTETASNGLVNKYYYNDDNLTTKIEMFDGTTLIRTVINTYTNNLLTKKVVRHHQSPSVYREVTESYKYDDKGNLIEYTNQNGDVSKFTYDSEYAMLLKSEVPLGNGKIAKTELTLDDNGNYATKKEYTSPTEYKETTYTVQAQGLLLREVTENGQLDYKVNYGYNLAPKMGFKDGENFHAAVYTKKWTDNRLTLNADGTTKYVKYQSEIDPTTKNIKNLTEPNGNKTNYAYDYKERIVKVEYPDGTNKTVTYDDANMYYIIKSPSGSKEKFIYDGFGSLLREQEYIEGIFRTIKENEYNSEYLISKEKDATANATTYSYDVFGRVSQSTYANGTKTRFEMDDYANTVKMYNQENEWTLSKYDDFSNLVEESKSVSGTIVKNTFTYDNTGNILTSTDPKGSKYTYEYDLLGQLVKVTDPNGSTSIYQYDKLGSLKLTQQKDASYNRTFQKQIINNQFGNPILSQDERGKNTKYWYDDNSNLIKHLDPNEEIETYTYDTRNNVKEIAYPNYKKTFDYDANNQLLVAKIYDSLTTSSPTKTYNYSYNELDQLKRRTSSDEKYVEYTYDSIGNVKTLKDYFGGITTYDYNDMNLLQSVNYGNKTFTYDYYSDGAIKTISYPIGNYKTEFTYDEGNHIKSLTNKKNTTVEKSFNYDYDTAGNLTQIKENDVVKAQGGYDKLGQLKALNTPGNTINYYYDVRGNMVAQIGRNPIELAYNLGDYQWNSEDRLIKFTSDNGDSTMYSYDDRGLRQTKKSTNEEIEYYYDNNSRLINENENGNQVTIVNGHLPLMRKINNDVYYYVYNGHGDVIGLLDENGTMVNEYTYDIWGKTISSRESVYNDLKYASEILDSETNNYYLRARYYSPETHRFISVDSYEGELKNPLSMNQNIYCYNNPLIYVDPSGHVPLSNFKKKPGLFEKAGKVLYAGSEVLLGGCTVYGSGAYIATTGGAGAAAGGAVGIAHGLNGIGNGFRDIGHIRDGDWDQVGTENYMKDHFYEYGFGAAGELIAGEEGQKIGENVGAGAYYVTDIVLGAKGTAKSIKELKNAKWTRGMIVPGNAPIQMEGIVGQKTNRELIMSITKDSAGYYYNGKYGAEEFIERIKSK